MALKGKPAALERGGLSEHVRLKAEHSDNSANAAAGQGNGPRSLARPRLVGSVAFAGSEVRVSIATVRGVPSVDVRSFQPFAAHTPKLMSAGQGVSVPVGRVIALAAMLVEAEDQARAMGLIGGDE